MTESLYLNSMDRSERDSVEAILLFMDKANLNLPNGRQIVNELILSAKNGDSDGAIEQLGKMFNPTLKIRAGFEALGIASTKGQIGTVTAILSYIKKVDIEERHGSGTINSLLRK